MAEIKSLQRISEKWATVTPQRAGEYADGVRNPRADWAKNTLAASGAYVKGIQASIAAKRFDSGVARSGSANWQEKTLKKGPNRWAEGVTVSRSDYEAGFAPYRETIANTQLPPRGAKGDPSNINRVAVIAKALHDRKVLGR